MICVPNAPQQQQPKQAAGYDFEPLPNGDFLLELYGDDGYTFAEAILNQSQLESLPNVIGLVLEYVDQHGYPSFSHLDLPNRSREEIATTRREAMARTQEEEGGCDSDQL